MAKRLMLGKNEKVDIKEHLTKKKQKYQLLDADKMLSMDTKKLPINEACEQLLSNLFGSTSSPEIIDAVADFLKESTSMDDLDIRTKLVPQLLALYYRSMPKMRTTHKKPNLSSAFMGLSSEMRKMSIQELGKYKVGIVFRNYEEETGRTHDVRVSHYDYDPTGNAQPTPNFEGIPNMRTVSTYDFTLKRLWTADRILKASATIIAAAGIAWYLASAFGYPPPHRLLVPSQRTELMQNYEDDSCRRIGPFHNLGDSLLSTEISLKRAKILCAEELYRKNNP